VIDALRLSTVVVCPAYPKNGRITIGGYHLLHQALIENTEIAKDRASPVSESHIPTLIRSQSRHKVSLIDVSKGSEGVETLQREILEHQKSGNRIIIVDAVTQEDLKTVAQTTSVLGQPLLACGSAGLAEELPDALGLAYDKGPILVVAGSDFQSGKESSGSPQ